MPFTSLDAVCFFPFDLFGKTIYLNNPPLEGTVAEVLPDHYRINLPGLASCLVVKSNPTLARQGEEGVLQPPTSS